MLLPQKKIYLIRHGETEWTLSGQHTGLTDIPLTENGKKQAEMVGKRLLEQTFQTVLTSPLLRAQSTCEIAGLLKNAQLDPDLVEWNYGDFEGLTSTEIRKIQPHWTIFSNGALPEPGVATSGPQGLLKSAHGKTALYCHEGIES